MYYLVTYYNDGQTVTGGWIRSLNKARKHMDAKRKKRGVEKVEVWRKYGALIDYRYGAAQGTL